MRHLTRACAVAIVLIAPALAPTTASASTLPATEPQAISMPGQYVVTLSEGVDPRSLLARLGATPRFIYQEVLNGFAAPLTATQVTLLRQTPGVRSVEQDAQITAVASAPRREMEAAGSWGLDRINQRDLPLDGSGATRHDGSGVTAYIIDTGIDYRHTEFGGRATFGFDAMGDGRQGADCQGHGTHVAGTVGGATYGIAKRARLVSVRVLGCDAKGSWSGVIAGFDWVAAHAVRPAVANVSLGGTPGSTAVDNAVNALSDRGVFVAVAAGNDAADACQYSPARAARIITIGATTRTDSYAGYSNRGNCLELLAPGSEIVSAKLGGGSVALNGTSMATPHVAGVAALVKQAHGDRGQNEIMTWLWNNGTPNKITGTPVSTSNRLLYVADL